MVAGASSIFARPNRPDADLGQGGDRRMGHGGRDY
jgi:hypothetical protein